PGSGRHRRRGLRLFTRWRAERAPYGAQPLGLQVCRVFAFNLLCLPRGLVNDALRQSPGRCECQQRRNHQRWRKTGAFSDEEPHGFSSVLDNAAGVTPPARLSKALVKPMSEKLSLIGLPPRSRNRAAPWRARFKRLMSCLERGMRTKHPFGLQLRYGASASFASPAKSPNCEGRCTSSGASATRVNAVLPPSPERETARRNISTARPSSSTATDCAISQ